MRKTYTYGKDHPNYKHGMMKTKTYKSWQKMRERCDGNTNRQSRYKERGITYDPRWDDFLLFLQDMGERPKGMSLDRIDNDGNYSKENCRWASDRTQFRNMSINVWYKIDGVKYIQEDAYKKLGVTIKKLRYMRDRNTLPDNVTFLGTTALTEAQALTLSGAHL
jgi:hypothetical protein